MKKQALILSLLVVATSCANSNVESDYEKSMAQAEQGPGGPPSIDEVFKMDTNNDGKLSKTEVSGPLLTDFDKIDSNKDGFITRDEFKNAPKPQGRPEGGQRPPQRN